jgi:hypothetical protein
LGKWLKACEKLYVGIVSKRRCKFATKTYCIDIFKNMYSVQMMPKHDVSDLLKITIGMSHILCLQGWYRGAQGCCRDA